MVDIREDGKVAAAADAIALTQATRARMAVRAASPRWYAPLYGLCCGGLIASFALPDWYAVGGIVASLMSAILLYAVWSRRSGLSVKRYRSGRTRRVVATLLVAYLLAWSVAFTWRGTWVPLAAGAVFAVAAAFASRAWDRAWRTDIAEL